jgi:hypothetical protein
LGKKLKHSNLMMVGSTHQMTSRDFVKFIEFCNNLLHHIPQNKIVFGSTKIKPWLNLHITCSNLQIFQICLRGKVVATTCYLQNVSRISIMDEFIFYEACHWIGSKPDLQHLWIFGCLAYEHVLKEL